MSEKLRDRRVLDYLNTQNLNIHERPLERVGLDVLDVQDDFGAFEDSAEDRVLVVQPG